jgi:hypothetical protein
MHATLGFVLVAVVASTAAAEPASAPEAARLDQLSDIFEVRPLIDRIQRAPTSGSVEDRLERLQLRQDAFSELDRLALMIDATLARLEGEQYPTINARNTLNARHARTVVTWSIAATLVGSGTGIVATALQFESSTAGRVGNGIAIGGSALALTFSIVALTRKNRGTPPYAIRTNCLAQLFDRTPTPESALPRPVWRYLDTRLPGEPASLRSQLRTAWVEDGTLPATPSADTQRTIDLLTRPISARESIPAEVLGQRAHMLADLRARVALMKVDLQEMVRHVRGSER